MLTRQPLRYLLADGPGAGKTSMAVLVLLPPASRRPSFERKTSITK